MNEIVVKASEPVFTAGISAIFLKQYLPWQVYATLIPVCAGVALASVTELSFSWYCLYAGIGANVFAAARGVFGKIQMCGDDKCVEQLSPENYYAVLTILSFIMLVPAALFMEGGRIFELFRNTLMYFTEAIKVGPLYDVLNQAAFGTGDMYKMIPNFHSTQGFIHALLSGILFYLYNEVSFRCLNKVHPVTHAVANTVKRIVIILSSVLVFQNPITNFGILGSSLAVLGVFLYSIAQDYYKPKKA